MKDNPSPRPGRKRLARSLSRTTRLVLIGGTAAGAGFATVTGIASATAGPPPGTSASSSAATLSTATTVAPPLPPWGGARPHPLGPGPLGGPGARMAGGLGPGPGGPGGPGGGGTGTAIKGSTLSLRTMNGTETVQTSPSTTYTKEVQSIALSDLRVGDVVHVAPTSASPGASPPAQSGTGTIQAGRVAVVEPAFLGRVVSSSNGTYTLVGRDGQLLTVSTTTSTRYYSGRAQASASAVSDASHVVAEGPRDSLTHLSADVVVVLPAPPAGS